MIGQEARTKRQKHRGFACCIGVFSLDTSLQVAGLECHSAGRVAVSSGLVVVLSQLGQRKNKTCKMQLLELQEDGRLHCYLVAASTALSCSTMYVIWDEGVVLIDGY